MAFPTLKPAPVQIYRAWMAGIKNPVLVWNTCQSTKLPFPVACAFLQQESDGGKNVYGHDDSIFSGYGKVTPLNYANYKRARDATRPRRMQGVGPMQLTWYVYQDLADELGGCWVPRHNLTVGFNVVRGLYLSAIEKGTASGLPAWRRAALGYNGSSSYAYAVAARITEWYSKLS